MMLGKRARPPMKRTTSMTEFTLDLTISAAGENPRPPYDPFNKTNSGGVDRRSLVSPRNHRRNSADNIETPHFLRACHLCNRRLIPGRDIFMYRGDSAFCSLECRQEQMNEDEKKKCSLVSNKQTSASTVTATTSKIPSNTSKTIASV